MSPPATAPQPMPQLPPSAHPWLYLPGAGAQTWQPTPGDPALGTPRGYPAMRARRWHTDAYRSLQRRQRHVHRICSTEVDEGWKQPVGPHRDDDPVPESRCSPQHPAGGGGGVEHRGTLSPIAPRHRHGRTGHTPHRLRTSSGHRRAVEAGAMCGCTDAQCLGGTRGAALREVAGWKSAMQLGKLASPLPW
jgi:hypothetical protein